MHRTQVYLTAKEREGLIALARETGAQQSSLIREAIDQFIEGKKLAKKRKGHALKSAAGMWADRNDLPDLKVLRKEFDREF
ncbi:MAG: ribbon-helix-helix domain-containing protein [Parachlamydiaceae bacterium]|nr:ribbon-helix-helix domain-containing protein [Parachlamydiaceae bacterium]